MKNLALTFGLIICTSFGFAQETQPVGEQISENTLKVTYFHSNGQVMHQGNYVDGKSDGLWKSFDEAGNLIAEGSFEQGKKTGLWNFYSTKALKAVVYNENAVADVKKFNTNALAEK
jgi:antitoxin component YwqK of YwqJK toxin-antitoxin module